MSCQLSNCGSHPNGQTPRTYPRNANYRKRISKSKRAFVYERDQYRCRECGSNGDQRGGLTIDHIIAIQHGGTNAVFNLRTLCAVCNQRKNRRYEQPKREAQ